MNGRSHFHRGPAHQPHDTSKAFAVGVGLNLAFVLIEAVFGIISNSLALLADAGHNLSDVLGLLIAWMAASLARRPPTRRYTYGWRGSTIVAALANASLLFVAVGAIGWESMLRLFHPQNTAAGTTMAVAAAGIVINGATAWLFASGRKRDLNIRGAYLHMLADAAVSAGVVLSGGLIIMTGKNWIDPLTSLGVVAIILWGTWALFRDSLALSMSGVPPWIDAASVADFLRRYPGVSEVHDLHIWAMSTTETALTAHLVVPSGPPGDEFVHRLAEELRRKFAIHHSTLQVEQDGALCPFSPADVV